MIKDPHKDIFTIGIGGAAGEGVKKAGIEIGALLHDLGFQIYLSLEYPSLIRGGHNFVRLSAGKEKVWNDHSKLDVLVAINEETLKLHSEEMKEGSATFFGTPMPEIKAKIQQILKDRNFEAGEPKGELIDSNRAFSKGLQAAGLDFYLAYPMTPTTSILHYLAGQQKSGGLKVIQPENEIAGINMALGMIYAGKRAAVGSATGGFALMQEAFSFAGIAEFPIVVAVSQRQAPATGVPTHSSQSDLRFVIHAGHGEFPRIVISPGDPEESFRAGREAMNLAWKFQVPVIVLLDKILSEHMMTSSFDAGATDIHRGKLAENPGENYGRYEITPDGISPIAFPGTPNTIVKITSYEHDEKGITTEEAKEVKKMLDKRFAKISGIQSEMQNQETVKVYGDASSENAIVFFGSTKHPLLEAAKYINKSIKFLQIIWMEPFDVDRVKKELDGKKRIICVEANHNSQLAGLVREKTGIDISEKILKYDSLPFDPVVLAEQIDSMLN